jgi:hypothetical protein
MMNNYKTFLAGQYLGAWLRTDQEVHDKEIRSFTKEIGCDYNLLTSTDGDKSLNIVLKSINDNMLYAWFLVGFDTFHLCNGKIAGNMVDGVLLSYRKKLEDAGVSINDRDLIESLLTKISQFACLNIKLNI